MPVSQEQDGQQSKEISLQGNVSSTLIFFVNGEYFVFVSQLVGSCSTYPFSVLLNAWLQFHDKSRVL